MKTVSCHIQSITQLTPHVYRVLLQPEQKVESEEKINFVPGQYLNFIMSEDDKRPFSIASSPNSALLELQIGAFVADSYPMQVIDRIKSCAKSNSTVDIEIPLGNAQLRIDSDRPLLFVAGGTGFSYIKSMFEYLAEENSTREIHVYWGLREESACYDLAQTQNLLAKLPNAHFVPVIENATELWQGETGLVHKIAMKNMGNLAPYDIYLAGRFDMVKVLRDDFIGHGANKDHMYADAFAFI